MPPQPNQPYGKRPTRIQRTWSAISSPFSWTDKHVIEPFAKSLDQADIFKVFEKLSPVLEAIGVIAIPLVIWFATASAQGAKDKSEKAARAQEAVKTYLNQLSSVFLDGNLEKDERLRIVTRASTLALLQDPSLDGTHKGQVIRYLIELKLVQARDLKDGDNIKGSGTKEPIISLEGSDLSGADLSGVNLNGANLRLVNLTNADLTGAKLNSANLRFARLGEASLYGADLRDASLRDADLSRSDLNGAFLENALLGGANLAGTKLGYVNLRAAADLSRLDFLALYDAKLCETALPPDIELDPNRDCNELGIIKIP